jgi:hypothetical protein
MVKYTKPPADMYKILGKAILFASMQFAIGSVEMSSKFSVKNFSKDQETLQNAADALSDYIMIALFWTIGTSFLFYSNYKLKGLLVNLLANFAIVAWIVISYFKAFKDACKKSNLVMPKLFKTIKIKF